MPMHLLPQSWRTCELCRVSSVRLPSLYVNQSGVGHRAQHGPLSEAPKLVLVSCRAGQGARPKTLLSVLPLLL